LRTAEDSITVPPRSYIVFGDNTVNSLDSRFWGALSEQNVIGKSFFIYWPITTRSSGARFGWGQQ
jgi:signal peptidase I